MPRALSSWRKSAGGSLENGCTDVARVAMRVSVAFRRIHEFRSRRRRETKQAIRHRRILLLTVEREIVNRAVLAGDAKLLDGEIRSRQKRDFGIDQLVGARNGGD